MSTKKSQAAASPWQDLDAYIAQPRLVSLELSPDGDWLLAGIQSLNQDRTAFVTALWRIDPAGLAAPHRLTRGVEGETAAAILRDGSVIFTSDRTLPRADAEREDPGKRDKALWCLPARGGEAHVLARREGGWLAVQAARRADRLVCTVGMRAGLDAAQDRELRTRRSRTKVAAILHEGGGVRHWDHDLTSDTVRFLAAELPAGQEPSLTDADLRPVTADLGPELTSQSVLAPGGGFLVVQRDRRLPHGQRRADLARIDVETGELTELVTSPEEDHHSPVLSDDERWLACIRRVPGTPEETFHHVLHLVDLADGSHRDLAADWPRWASPVAFSPDAATLYVTADEDGECPVFAVAVATGEVRRLTGHGAHSQVRLAPDGSALYALRSAWDEPPVIVRIDPATGDSTVVHTTQPELALPGRLERVETTAPDGTRIRAWLALPHEASAASPVPLVLWVHGGPVSSWNAWSWRWCPWLLVSTGRAVLLPDPALSTGYGRQMVQRGWGNWGPATLTDVEAITDAVEARPDIRQDRTAMMGGSFGGYMANWIAGHTNRFRCIVSHASLWNLASFGPTTDAPWFWEQEMSPAMMAANSPHQFADRITTPMLVIHGDKDYRVPIGEGLALWWALVSGHAGPPETLPHKFLYFPDENHWILTPQHAVVWYQTVQAFLATHLDGVDWQRPDRL
ncbi:MULTISPECIES: prolyl oligopeptidase family serine peptidase [unclassified Luteococcus]|uniref:prolyl oligopeptidase family serine peptidase n=1 Tax=unclassified Luteococcus TaxID=2639923 RepID=UPI00313AD3D6